MTNEALEHGFKIKNRIKEIDDNDNEYLCSQDRWNAHNIREEFHAANAHDITEYLEYLMSL